MAGYTEEQYEQSRTATPADPPKGSAEWAAQNSGMNAPEVKSSSEPMPGTPEVHNNDSKDSKDSTVPEVVTSTDSELETPGISTDMERLRADATAGFDRQIRTVQDFLDSEENQPESEEKRRERERKEKSKRIIAAVSDGLSALGNLYFTSQYAPSMYNHEKGMATAVRKRLDEQKAERERKRDQYMNFSLKLGDLENQRAATLRELEAQHERQKLAREKAEREAEAHGWAAALQPDKQREQAGRANKAEQEAITAKAVADAAPEMQRKKLATEDARKKNLEASTLERNTRAGYYGAGGAAGAQKHHFMGKEYVSKLDYHSTVAEEARKYNARHKNDQGFVPIVTERSTTAGKVARKPEEYAGEVETRLEEERKANSKKGKGYGDANN